MIRHQAGRSILNRRSFLKVGAALSAGALRLPRCFAVPSAVSPSVETTGGPVKGLIDDGVHSFLGVPYAAPPVGDLRFMPPQKRVPVADVTYAVRYGNSAMQLRSGGSAVSYPGDIGPALGQVFSSRLDAQIQDEDCLVLNVWTPGLSSGGRRPVMVWFHGGGFNYGSGSWPAYNGHNLAANHDVVVVTVNHRLNAFGYLNLAEIGGERYAHSGNVGQLDLIAALEWVRDNIANFGGDPGNVTIFGQSGGGAKVSTLLAMPSAQGLFHRAIIQSGASLQVGSQDDAANMARALLDKLQISSSNFAQLIETPAETLLAAASQVAGRFGPILDDRILPTHPFEPSANSLGANVPVMVGCTKDEQTLYVVGFDWWRNLSDDDLLPRLLQMPRRSGDAVDHAEELLGIYRELHPGSLPRYLYTDVASTRHFLGSLLLAQRKAEQRAAPAYLYVFDWEAPVEGGLLKSPHTLEIPFVFDNVEVGPILLGTELDTRLLGRRLSEVWTAFARTGNPNTPAMPDWQPYSTTERPTMLFNCQSRVVRDHRQPVRELLARR
jgi:para-nitrobenzyl esterase